MKKLTTKGILVGFILMLVVGPLLVSMIAILRAPSHVDEETLQQWMVSEMPFLEEAAKIDGYQPKVDQVEKETFWGRPTEMLCSVMIPFADNSRVLKMNCSVNTENRRRGINVYSTSFYCLMFDEMEVTEVNGSLWNTYSGIQLTEEEFEEAITSIRTSGLPDGIEERLAAVASPICWCDPEHDSYQRYFAKQE